MKDLILSTIPIEELETLIERSVSAVIKSLPKENDSIQYISIKTAANILGVSRVTVYEYINNESLKKYKIASNTRLLKSEVLSIVEQV